MSNVVRLFPDASKESDPRAKAKLAAAIAVYLASSVELTHAVKVLQAQLDVVGHLIVERTDTDSRARLKRSAKQVREKLAIISSQLSLRIEELSRIHESYSSGCGHDTSLDENEVYSELNQPRLNQIPSGGRRCDPTSVVLEANAGAEVALDGSESLSA